MPIIGDISLKIYKPTKSQTSAPWNEPNAISKLSLFDFFRQNSAIVRYYGLTCIDECIYFSLLNIVYFPAKFIALSLKID